MRQLQEGRAVIEESRQPVALGNRVSMELYASVIDAEESDDDDDAEAEAAVEHDEPEASLDHDHDEVDDHDHDEDHDHDDDHDHDHNHGLGDDEFIHEHNATLVLDADHEEPAPGFRDQLVGLNVGDEKIFELTYPDNTDEYEDMAGKKARFKVKISKIETMTLPVVNDDFAARVTEKEEKQLTLLELRMRLRESIEKAAEERARSAFADEALEAMVEKATVVYPDLMLQDQLDSYLKSLDQEFRRQKLTLEDYMRITNKTREQLKDDYREVATAQIKRAVVLREIRAAEKVEVDPTAVDGEINKMLEQFGPQAEMLRSSLDTPQMRFNILNDMLEKATRDRIIAIARGDAPELPASTGDETTPTEQSVEGEPTE